MGSVKKRGKTWWIKYAIRPGHYREESAHTSRKAEAEALLRKREHSVWEGTFELQRKHAEQITLGELRDLWLREKARKRSIKSDRARLAAAVAYFGEGRLIAELEAADVIKWRDHLRALPGWRAELMAEATVNRHLAALRGAYNLATARGFPHRDPFSGVRLEKERNRRNRLCTPDEYATLRDAADPELRILIAIGYGAGMRLGEVVGLRWHRIDLKSGVLRLEASATKEADVKSVPLPREALVELERLPRRLDGRVFRYQRAETYSAAFSALCKACGIEGLHYHDLRHSAISCLHRAGVPVKTIMSITGHKALVTVLRYIHVTDEDLRRAMEAADAARGG